MLGAVALGHLRGERRLVVRRAAKLFECQGDGAHLVLTGISHQAQQRAQVDASREKSANFDIGDHMGADAVEHGIAHPRAQLSVRRRMRAALG